MPHPSHCLISPTLRALALSALILAPASRAVQAQDAAPAAPATAPATATAASDVLFTGATALYDSALQERVDKNGRIDYAKLKGNKNLEAFVALLPSVDVSKFPTFEIKEEEKDDEDKNIVARRDKKKAAPKIDRSWELAFWINAHNAHVLQAISSAYPIGSPDELKDLETRKFAVAGGEYTLTQLRTRAGALDPRAPFAMIDGTLGGPKMAPRALRAYGIGDTLDSAVSAIVDDERQVELQRIQNRVTVSPFLASIDSVWKPRTARRKWDGIRYLLSSYTRARANKSYFTTNEYQIFFGEGDRKVNAVPPTFEG